MLSDELLFGTIIVVVGGLWLYAACTIGWGVSKGIQPFVDDFFGSSPRKRKQNKPTADEATNEDQSGPR
jgi:hypothetical protein